MPLHRAPMVRPGALSAHGTGGTHSSGSLVFERASNRMHPAWLKDLAGRTTIDVLHRIVRQKLHRRTESLLIINRAVVMITRPRLTTSFSHAGCVWVALAHHPVIDPLVTLRRAARLQFALSGAVHA